MAGLALLFAIGLVRKNKFIILDEADAHLDDLNRNQLITFIKEVKIINEAKIYKYFFIDQ